MALFRLFQSFVKLAYVNSTQRQLDIKTSPMLIIRGYRHLAAVVVGDNEIGIGQAVLHWKAGGAIIERKERLENIELFFVG